MDYETSVILGRYQIRLIAGLFRKMFNIKTVVFPVMKVLEMLVTRFEKKLFYVVEEDSLFEKGVMAELVSEEDIYYIRIRQGVYDKANDGDRASICYICHEMCHFFLIHVMGIGPKMFCTSEGLVYTRKVVEKTIPSYKSMEWQTKALCGEVMIPYRKCKNYTYKQIVYRTKSSNSQAKYFIEKVLKFNE